MGYLQVNWRYMLEIKSQYSECQTFQKKKYTDNSCQWLIMKLQRFIKPDIQYFLLRPGWQKKERT